MNRLDKLEIMVNRLSRRSVKKMSAIITPVPISNCVIGEEVKGDILKYLFPCPGTIVKGGIFLPEKLESGAAVVLTIEGSTGNKSRSYQITRRNMILEPNIKTDTWDRLTISFHTINPEKDKVNEVWIALLWTPKVKDATIKNYLIEKLDAED